MGKEYTCFQNDSKTSQADKCVKYRIMIKVIDYILSIDTFEQQCVVLKGMSQSLRLKYHVKIIGIDQSLRNTDLFEHKRLQKIKKLHRQAGKCDKQQQFKDILEADMVSTPVGLTYDNPRYTMTS